jgi:hypothetical protein
MQKAIKFVAQILRGKKDATFIFQRGRICAVNGPLRAEHAFPYDLDGACDAGALIRAAAALDEREIVISQTKTRITIKQGAYKAQIPVKNEPYQYAPLTNETDPTGWVGLDALTKYTAESIRPFTRGVILQNGRAYATNNAVLASLPGPQVPQCVIPARAIDIAAKMGAASVAIERNGIEFRAGDTATLAAQLVDAQPPDMRPFFDGGYAPAPLPESVRVGFGKIKTGDSELLEFRDGEMICGNESYDIGEFPDGIFLKKAFALTLPDIQNFDMRPNQNSAMFSNGPMFGVISRRK